MKKPSSSSHSLTTGAAGGLGTNSGADDFNDEERAVVGGMTLKDSGE